MAVVEGTHQPFMTYICVNGYNLYAMRDTGCATHTIISPRFVGKDDNTGEYMSCKGVFEGVCHKVPLAEVRMYIPDLSKPSAPVWLLTLPC